jgi:hypothetical protein
VSRDREAQRERRRLEYEASLMTPEQKHEAYLDLMYSGDKTYLYEAFMALLKLLSEEEQEKFERDFKEQLR